MAEQQLQVELSSLSNVPGSRKKRTRVGRGMGSGVGKTSGRGVKGQTSRRGKGRPKGFEGGQNPLYRRLPKYGFKNPFRVSYEVVNLHTLEAHFKDGDTVDPEKLETLGLLKPKGSLVKILATGDLKKKLTVKAHRFSKSAIQKINNAGGQVEEIKLGSS